MVWLILIHASNLPKNSFGISRASVLRWYCNTNMISFRKGLNSMMLAIPFYCSFIGMNLIFASFLMQLISLLLVLVQKVLVIKVLSTLLLLERSIAIILGKGRFYFYISCHL